MNNNWRVWNKAKEYGNVFFARAIGNLPEMESSKSAARAISSIAKENYLIMDIGCGAGHYLVSLDNTLKIPFKYYGIDATPYYIEMAKKALFERNTNPLRLHTNFEVGDIFHLTVRNNFADITMCNNLLLHLPSIEKPIRELWRITRKFVVIRTLIGNISFRIKQIDSPEEYTEEGEPVYFQYFNIYFKAYIEGLIRKLSNVKEYTFIEDNSFNPDKIVNSKNCYQKVPHNLTTVVNGMQANNYIIQPWKFVIIEKKE
ncbi:MAG: class I SAM-dependent methyltransferase [Candidatus Brocadia sp.]|nr:class I SAM-dependent methyltransferase [Candidatus Brocadia sp.]